jgi:hypothetical protein
MGADLSTARLGRPARTVVVRCPWRSPAVQLAPVLVILSLIGCGGSAVNGHNQTNSSPLTVSSPDLTGGTFPREFTCDGANRRPAYGGARRHPAPGSWPSSCSTRRAGRHLHPLAGLRDPSRHHEPGSRAGRHGRRRQRLRSARLRRPVPAARRRASLPLRSPRLDTWLGLAAGARRSDLESRISGHVLARGDLVATYRRA